MSRSVGEIRSELERERARLTESTTVLRDEIERSIDVRRQLRRHPLVRLGLGLLALVVASLVLAGVLTVVRSIAGLLRVARRR
jgi:hypothetical protein